MYKSDIEKFIEKYNLGDDAFVIYRSSEYDKAFLGMTNHGGDYYIDEMVAELDLNEDSFLYELKEVLNRFCAVVFDWEDVKFCENSWDGYQPILTIEEYYKLPPYKKLEDIF